mmetsp:Transcript_70996/g.219479  ORF Transcript_70996/g.219479 Transcript_70996/m.219479 type:complete len:322 (+) Transcript_70996:185-1150(+)
MPQLSEGGRGSVRSLAHGHARADDLPELQRLRGRRLRVGSPAVVAYGLGPGLQDGAPPRRAPHVALASGFWQRLEVAVRVGAPDEQRGLGAVQAARAGGDVPQGDAVADLARDVADAGVLRERAMQGKLPRQQLHELLLPSAQRAGAEAAVGDVARGQREERRDKVGRVDGAQAPQVLLAVPVPVQARLAVQGLPRLTREEVAADEVDVAGAEGHGDRVQDPGVLGDAAEPRVVRVEHGVALGGGVLPAALVGRQREGGLLVGQPQERSAEAPPLVLGLSRAEFADHRHRGGGPALPGLGVFARGHAPVPSRGPGRADAQP